MEEKGVVQESAFLELEALGNTEIEFLKRGRRMVNDEAITKIEGSIKLSGLYRYISEILKWEKSMEIIEGDEEWSDGDNNKGMKLIDDYDLGDSHGLGEGKQVRDTDSENQLGSSQRKSKQDGAIMSKERVMEIIEPEMPGVRGGSEEGNYNSYGDAT